MEVKKVIFATHGEPVENLKKEIVETFTTRDKEPEILETHVDFLKRVLLSYPDSSYSLIIFSKPDNARRILHTIRRELRINKPVFFLNALKETSVNNTFFLKSISAWAPKTV